MERWGESLFAEVFPKSGPDPTPHALYEEAVRVGLETCELSISSEDARFLNIPWELIRDPTPGRGYLAPLLGGLYRQRTGMKLDPLQEAPGGRPFRILLVIARPYGDQDIPLGTVARPLLEALRPLGKRVEVELLRPPTFDAVQRRLNEHRGFYDVVHFDGHGVFGKSLSEPVDELNAEVGHLVFEKASGGPETVTSKDIGQALATCKVPVFILNACQSGEESATSAFGSVASQLVALGSKGVVAMSYSVYAEAAARFMQRFYERILVPVSLSSAVADARKRLHAEPDRESVVGEIKLRDWMVPVLYQQEIGYLPFPKAADEVAAAGGEPPVRSNVEEECPAGRFGFVGRDYDLLRIERGLRDSQTPCTLLSGVGGTGKSELAYGFARWYAETGGCPGGVFVTSFKAKADFAQVVGSTAGFGTEFSRLPEGEQREHLVRYLREHACLLVWDNFETVAGYPPGTEPLASEGERAKLSGFLRQLRGGQSRVLITTRKPAEDWLGTACVLCEVGGLVPRDVATLARLILKTAGRVPEDFREDPYYANLLTRLKGHPRSLEVVLPLLKRANPGEILASLDHRIDQLGETLEDASLAYAFSRLSPVARKHLTFLGLFASYVRQPMIERFVTPGAMGEAGYRSVMGETLDGRGWTALLQEAAESGLVRTYPAGLYELHPTLSPYLRKELANLIGGRGVERLDREFASFYANWASLSFENIRRGDPLSVQAAVFEEANLLRALRIAEETLEWEKAKDLAQTLNELYAVRGRAPEWKVIRRDLLEKLGIDSPETVDPSQVTLWVFLVGEEAKEAIQRNELDTAEALYRPIQEYLVSNRSPALEPALAIIYNQLGVIADGRGQIDSAEQWYRKALEICERLGLNREAAMMYHQLGGIAKSRTQFDLAEQWYRKSLQTSERAGLEREAALEYRRLGVLAQEGEQLDHAEQYYLKALEIHERLGLERDAANEYNLLGIISQKRHQLDSAEQWYRKSLEIFERLGLERETGGAYHNFGILAEQRQQLDQAEQWYRKALEIYERLGLERDVADEYHALGVVAEQRQQLDQAEQWCRKALEVCERLGAARDAGRECYELGNIAEQRDQLDVAETWYQKALQSFQGLGYWSGVAYQRLGNIAGQRDHPEIAEKWYEKAFEVFKGLGPESAIVDVCNELGLIALNRQEADLAEKWYKKALETFHESVPPASRVATLTGLGLLDLERGLLPQAISWFGQTLQIAEVNQMPFREDVLQQLNAIAKTMGKGEFQRAWRKSFGDRELPIDMFKTSG